MFLCHAGHEDRLGVMGDHSLHELHVGDGIRRARRNGDRYVVGSVLRGGDAGWTEQRGEGGERSEGNRALQRHLVLAGVCVLLGDAEKYGG